MSRILGEVFQRHSGFRICSLLPRGFDEKESLFLLLLLLLMLLQLLLQLALAKGCLLSHDCSCDPERIPQCSLSRHFFLRFLLLLVLMLHTAPASGSVTAAATTATATAAATATAKATAHTAATIAATATATGIVPHTLQLTLPYRSKLPLM